MTMMKDSSKMIILYFMMMSFVFSISVFSDLFWLFSLCVISYFSKCIFIS